MVRTPSRGEVVRRKQEEAKTQERSRKIKRAVLAVLGLLAVSLLAAVVVFWGPLLRAIRHERLRAGADQFLAYGGEKGPEVEPYVKGKVIAMDRRSGELDPVQSRLPGELRAYAAGEVGTVAWLEWDFVETRNGPRLSGHYSTCKITVVDRENNRVVAEKTVMGATSPVSRGTKYVPPGQQTATRAESSVVSYLQSLPRR